MSRTSAPRPPREPGRLVVPAALIAAMAVSALAAVSGARPEPAGQLRSVTFQRLLGGLGSGSATSLSEAAESFDVRLGRTPYERLGGVRAAAVWDVATPARGN